MKRSTTIGFGRIAGLHIRRRVSPTVPCLAVMALFSGVAGGDAVLPELRDRGAVYAEAYEAGRYAEALSLAKEAIEREFGSPPIAWAADYAEMLHLTGRYDDAQTVLGDVVRRVYEPLFTVRLAEMYRHSGKIQDAEFALEQAMRQNMGRFRQDYPRENLLAMGKIARLQGENPRRILQIYQQRLLQRYPDFLPGFLEAGEIALDGYGYDVAEDYFLAALALDATRQSALAGLAATYYAAGDLRFEEVRARLEALNPHHPRLQCILIERHLMAGNAGEARALLDDLLGINPNHHEGLAYQAGLAFLEGDSPRQLAILDRLAELKPGSALGYRIVGELAARRYRFAEAVGVLRTGLDIEPDNRAAKAELGLNLLRLGEDAAGRKILEAVFEEDGFNVQVYNMLEVLDTLDGFSTVENDDFSIRLPAHEAAVMGDGLLALLDEALARYAAEYAVEVKRPVHVQVFDDHDEFMVRSVGLPGNPGHLGICFGNLVTLDSPRARDPQTMNWRSVLWHEFVHVITLQKTNNRIPRWLSEGISVYEEHQRDPGWGQPLDPEFKPLLTPGAWPAMESLEDYFVRPETPTHLMLGYFLAGAFVEAYVGQFGKPALVAALDEIRGGASAEAALSAAADGDVNAQFAAHLEQVCVPLAQIALLESEEAGILSSLIGKAPFDEALEAGQAAEAAGNGEEAREQYEKAAAMYPDYPGAGNPLRRLAHLAADSGDRDRWYAAVRRLQEHDPTAYAESKALMGALAEAGDHARAMEMANWCLGIDPFDPDLYRTQMAAQHAGGDHHGLLKTLDVLARLDPVEADSYRLEKARQLRALNRVAEARHIVLTLLEDYPEYRAAQMLLLELHEAVEEVVHEDS